MRILLEGDNAFEFIPTDRAKLTEAMRAPNHSFPLTIPGRFSECGVINGNRRRYSRPVWEKNLTPGSPLQEAIKSRRSLGLLEHPKDGQISLLSPISHLVTEARLEGNEVYGSVTLINTNEGHKMGALIEAGYNPFVSSRGYGSVVTASDGIDDVQEDFVCESWDLVFNPSFKRAELTPERSTTTATLAAPLQVPAMRESLTEAPVAGAPKVTATPSPVITENKTKTTMDLKTITESFNSLRNVDASKLDPRRLAEGLTQMDNLHREVAVFVASNPTLGWDGQKLHESLSVLEQAWTATAAAPAANVLKLNERQARLGKVLHEVAATGLKYRNQLTEAFKKLTHKTKLAEEVARRGQTWRKRALQAENQGALVEKRFQLACVTLDEFKARYDTDTTKMGRALLKMEYADKLKDPAILKRVTEAKTLEQLTVIREEIAPKAAAKAVVTESTPATTVAAAPATAATLPATPSGQTVRVESTVRAFTVSESIACSGRLNEASRSK